MDPGTIRARAILERATFAFAAAAAALFPLGVLASIVTGDLDWGVDALFAGWLVSLVALIVVVIVFAPTRNPLDALAGSRGTGPPSPAAGADRPRARRLGRAALLLSAGSLVLLTVLIPPVAAGVA